MHEIEHTIPVIPCFNCIGNHEVPVGCPLAVVDLVRLDFFNADFQVGVQRHYWWTHSSLGRASIDVYCSGDFVKMIHIAQRDSDLAYPPVVWDCLASKKSECE